MDIPADVSRVALGVVMTGHGADELFYGYPGNNNLALFSSLLPLAPAPLRPAS